MTKTSKIIVPRALIDFVEAQIARLDSVRGLSTQEDLVRRQAALSAYEEIRKRITEG